MNTAEEAERIFLFDRACYFLVLAEKETTLNSIVPAILYSFKAVLCALSAVLLMNGKNYPSFVTSLDSEIEIFFDERILNIRNSFFAEFVSIGKLDGSFGYMVQVFLEISTWTRSLARNASSQEVVARSLKLTILPFAHEIVGKLARFSGHDRLR